MRASYLAIVAAHALLSGCAVGPKYKRPELPVPTSFRAPDPLPELNRRPPRWLTSSGLRYSATKRFRS